MQFTICEESICTVTACPAAIHSPFEVSSASDGSAPAWMWSAFLTACSPNQSVLEHFFDPH